MMLVGNGSRAIINVDVYFGIAEILSPWALRILLLNLNLVLKEGILSKGQDPANHGIGTIVTFS